MTIKKMKRFFTKKMLLTKRTRTFLLLALFILIGFFLGRRQALFPNGTNVSAGQLKRMLQKKNFTFINVHTPYEGEIEKTDLIIPYDKIVENSALLPKDKNAPIILYCRSGNMSSQALVTMQKLGYTNVKHLSGGFESWEKAGGKLLNLSTIGSEVLPPGGVELPISWGLLGKKLVESGVINLPEFRKIMKLTPEQEKIFTQGSEEKIRIDATNSQFVVDVLWALGLAQKSIVYDEGPMGKEEKAQVGNFASTGGWNLAKGDAVSYLNKFDFIPLTADQQKKVGEIAKNVYRPCCGNPTWFPDCNHGMAALAIIELLVSNNVDERTIYQKILGFNSFWFPDTYLTAATYLARQGIDWNKADAKELVGPTYSNGQGAREISRKVGPLPYRQTSGGSCGT